MKKATVQMQKLPSSTWSQTLICHPPLPPQCSALSLKTFAHMHIKALSEYTRYALLCTFLSAVWECVNS